MTLDPNDYTIQELGPELKDIEDVSELEEILQKEHRGENRQGALALIESRIEKFSEDEEDGDGEVDLAGMSVADVGNAVRGIDEVEELEALIDQEEAGEDRDSVKRLISQRIDSVQGSDEDEEEAAEAEEAEPRTPEERHPDLDHPTADKQHVRALDDGAYEDMWVYCETQRGELIDVSREMLGK
ncbi:MAG: electron transfer flavoprotein subunit alpha/FixB family protein, partial [Haloarculaceae archaeon]